MSRTSGIATASPRWVAEGPWRHQAFRRDEAAFFWHSAKAQADAQSAFGLKSAWNQRAMMPPCETGPQSSTKGAGREQLPCRLAKRHNWRSFKMRSLKTVLAMFAMLVLLPPPAAVANEVTNEECRAEFNRSAAATSCLLNWVRAFKPSSARYWRCQFQIKCTASDGRKVTENSSIEFNRFHSLIFCDERVELSSTGRC